MSANSKLNVGVIGCGNLAQSVHLPNLKRIPTVEIAALADPVEQMRDAASRFAPNARRYPDARSLLDSDVDAVIICNPSALHAQTALEAIRAGKHIYLEPPIATSLKEGEHVAEVLREVVTFQTGFHCRFQPLHREAKLAIRSGKIGRVLNVRTVLSTEPGEMPSWKRTVAQGGGALFELGSHHLDLLRFYLDEEPKVVGATFDSVRGERDSAAVQLATPNGISAQCFFSLSSVKEDRMEWYGEHGKLLVEEPSPQATPLRRAAALLPRLSKPATHTGPNPSHLAAMEHFIRSIQNGEPGSPGIEAGIASLRLTEHANRP